MLFYMFRSLGMNVSVAQPASLQSSTSTLISQVLTMRTVDCFHGHWCAAGVVTPCDQDFYNPYIDQNTPNARLRCPDYSHTEGTATVHKEQCICDTGFERVYELLNSTYNETRCRCPEGRAFVEEDGVYICSSCARGFYKPDVRNGLCLSCPDYPKTSTLNDGAVNEAEVGTCFERLVAPSLRLAQRMGSMHSAATPPPCRSS